MTDSAADWEACARFLADPATHGGHPVEVIDTHTAVIALSGERAWKLRRPVDFGWLDYATRARRRVCAEREVAWNAPTAPGLYIGIGAIAGGPGAHRLEPPGEATDDSEPLVVMRRFPDDALFDRMAQAGRLDAPLLRRTAHVVAAMHRRAPDEGVRLRLPALATQEWEDLSGLWGVLGRDRVMPVAEALRARTDAMGDALARPVRRCHGDLHLRNIVLWQGAPAPFDCIEFSEDLSHIDPLYDLAFLLMDLEHRGLAPLANAVLNAWAEAMAAEPASQAETAYGGLQLLPLYKAFRAEIRAKIDAYAIANAEGAAAEALRAEAHAYLDLAKAYLAPAPQPWLVAIGGRSGTGKSTLARAIAGTKGAVLLRSDAVRKGQAGVAETDKLPPEAYGPGTSERVYATMRARAGQALAAGLPVILDAAHLRESERSDAATLAAMHGATFLGLWLEAPRGLLAARVAARTNDASDADAGVVSRQFSFEIGPLGDWVTLDAARPTAMLAAEAEALIATA
ncbi:MAG: AAA family ATPase [Pseudomonadota bacterium]